MCVCLALRTWVVLSPKAPKFRAHAWTSFTRVSLSSSRTLLISSDHFRPSFTGYFFHINTPLLLIEIWSPDSIFCEGDFVSFVHYSSYQEVVITFYIFIDSCSTLWKVMQNEHCFEMIVIRQDCELHFLINSN